VSGPQRHLAGELLRLVAAYVYLDLLHSLNNDGVHLDGGLASRADGVVTASGEAVEYALCHLAPPCVVDADE
jgi:hypothetical protein